MKRIKTYTIRKCGKWAWGSKVIVVFFTIISPILSSAQTTIFMEDVGVPSLASTPITSYAGWSTAYTMTGSGTVDKTTPFSSGYTGSTGNGPVVLAQDGTNRSWQIAGVNTSGHTSISLSFGIYKQLNGGDGSMFIVEVSSDGTNYTALSFTTFPTGGGSNGWYSRTCTGTIPSTSNLRIRFTNTSTFSSDNYRLDDVKLMGTAACSPAPTVTNGERCGAGTVSLSASGSGGTYNWYNVSSGGSSLGTASSYTTPSISSTTLYYVSAVSGACESPRAAVTATISSLPSLSQVTTSGLLTWYKLNGNGTDASGNSNTATLLGSPTATTDHFGNATSAYSFDGSTQYISTANAVTTANTNTTTQGVWFKTNTTTGGLLLGIGASQTGASTAHDRLLYMSPAGTLVFGYYNGVDPCPTITSSSSYNDGQWHFALTTFSTTAGIKLYVDGSLISSAAISGTPGGVNGYYWRSAYLQMGSYWPMAPSSPYYFDGTLDEIFIYNRELSASEITTLYASANGASNDGPVSGCGGTLTLSVATIAGATTYSWTGPDGFTASTQNPTVTNMSVSKEGTYSVTVSTSNPGCTTSPAYTIGKVTIPLTGNHTWTGSTSNAWSIGSNWNKCAAPGAGDDVTIPDVTTDPVITGTANSRNLIVDTGGILTINSGGILNIYGNINNNGTYTDNGTTVLTGSSSQTVSGATTFNNLTLNNSNGATLMNVATVKGILTLTSGTLASGGNLTVNLNTGAIAGTGTGAITGNVTLYKAVTSDKYHYISSPLSDLTVSQWNDDVAISTGTQYNNLFTYNETFTDTTKTVGWEAVRSLSAPLEPMRGYVLYFRGPTTVDVTGIYTHTAAYSNSALTNTVSNTDGSGSPGSDGWHIMGNPYPSAIDWSAASGWTKSNVDDALYLWDPVNNRYASYINGAGTNGGTQYIPSMQSFWVKVNLAGGNGTLAMNNNVRVTSINPAIWRTAASSNLLRLSASSGAYKDETIIRFMEDADETFDSHADAYKKRNSGNTPSLYTMNGATKYSINSLPLESDYISIPVILEAGFSGVYTFTAEETGSFGNGDAIIFEDRILEIHQDLRSNPTYTCKIAKGDTTGRFFIHFRREASNPTVASLTSPSVFIKGSEQTISINFSTLAGNNATIVVSNTHGREMFFIENADISSGEYSILLPSVQAGIYVVKVVSLNQSTSGKVFLSK